LANRTIHETIGNMIKFSYFSIKSKFIHALMIRLTSLLFVFFITTLLSGCDKKDEFSSLSRILERGYVNVGTVFGPTNYYSTATGFAGFEYELAKKYAQSLNVELRIIPSYSIDELFIKLNTGEVDVLASGLSITKKRQQRFRFAPIYETITQKLVFKQGKVRPRKIEDLTGRLMVTSGSNYVENLEKLKKKTAV